MFGVQVTLELSISISIKLTGSIPRWSWICFYCCGTSQMVPAGRVLTHSQFCWKPEAVWVGEVAPK